MKLAQQEIKATMTVNTSDLGSKKKDEEPADKDAPARPKGQWLGITPRHPPPSHQPCSHPPLLCLRSVKDVPVVAAVTEEVKEQLAEASAVTRKAFTTYRREMEAEEHQAAAEGPPVPAADKGPEDGEMSVIITIMQPILRLLQLLCENHNRDLQVSGRSLGHFLACVLCGRFLILVPLHTWVERIETIKTKTTKKKGQCAGCPDAAVSKSGPSWSGFTMKNVLFFGSSSGQREMFPPALIPSPPQTSAGFH